MRSYASSPSTVRRKISPPPGRRPRRRSRSYSSRNATGCTRASSLGAIGGSISTSPRTSAGRVRASSSAITAPKLEPHDDHPGLEQRGRVRRVAVDRAGRPPVVRDQREPRRQRRSAGAARSCGRSRCRGRATRAARSRRGRHGATPTCSAMMPDVLPPDDDAFAETIAPTPTAPPSEPASCAAVARRRAPRRGAVRELSSSTARSRAAAWAGSSPPRIAGSAARSRSRSCSIRPAISSTRFQREALITARLQHPGIVPVYEAGRWPTGEPFFAMKLVVGPAARPGDRRRASTLEERLALLPRLAAACDAIAYAHSQRIIHRDLKPGNVLIGDFGETVVIDWGLAKDLDAADTLGLGEPRAAPAVEKPTRSRDADRVVDADRRRRGDGHAGVHGARAGARRAGRPARRRVRARRDALSPARRHAAVQRAHRDRRDRRRGARQDRAARASREKRAPRDLVAIVDRAMAPEPVDRYSDAGELAEELRRFLTGQLVGAHRYTALAARVGRFVQASTAPRSTIAAIAIVGVRGRRHARGPRDVVAARDRAESRARRRRDPRGRPPSS